jgi:hypothetical protein
MAYNPWTDASGNAAAICSYLKMRVADLAAAHLDRLLRCGFLERADGSDVYELTDLGRGFLSEYDRFKRLEDVLLRAAAKPEDGDDMEYSVAR